LCEEGGKFGCIFLNNAYIWNSALLALALSLALENLTEMTKAKKKRAPNRRRNQKGGLAT